MDLAVIAFTYSFCLIKKSRWLEGWLSGQEHLLLLLQKTQIQFMAPTWWLTSFHNTSSRGHKALFLAAAGTRHACDTHTYTHAGKNTHIHKKISL